MERKAAEDPPLLTFRVTVGGLPGADTLRGQYCNKVFGVLTVR